mmetsp:Transcript_24317/g.47738  ORF Transcript_24317/g.47738 Transcript_24317/m.47738 type:complete len:133 (-) Transcript_24317:532-930(-)
MKGSRGNTDTGRGKRKGGTGRASVTKGASEQATAYLSHCGKKRCGGSGKEGETQIRARSADRRQVVINKLKERRDRAAFHPSPPSLSFSYMRGSIDRMHRAGKGKRKWGGTINRIRQRMQAAEGKGILPRLH